MRYRVSLPRSLQLSRIHRNTIYLNFKRKYWYFLAIEDSFPKIIQQLNFLMFTL